MKVVIIVEVDNVHPSDVDPHDIAEHVIDTYSETLDANDGRAVEFVAAEWLDHSNPVFEAVMREEGVIR